METLAVAPDEDGYSYPESTDYLYAEREGYLPATRADVINSNKIIKVQWTVGIDEYKYLCNFNKANLGNDSEPFLCPLILDTAEAKDYECTIVPNSFAVPSQSGETYTVTCQLEVVPDPFTDDEIEDGTTSNAGTGADGEGYYAGSQELNTANFISVKRGRFVFSGLPTVLRRPSRFINVDKGNFVLTGQAAGSDQNKVIAANKGTFNLTGPSVGMSKSKILLAGYGSFVLSGQNVGLASNPDIYFSNVAMLLHMVGVDTGTSFIDSSGYHHTISRSGNPTTSTAQFKFNTSSGLFPGLTTPSRVNPAYHAIFDSLPGASIWTIDGWIRPATIGTEQQIIAKQSGTSFYPFLVTLWTDGKIKFLCFDNSGTPNLVVNITSTAVLSAANWYYFMAVRNGSSFELRIGGNVEGTASSAASPLYNQTIDPILVGAPGTASSAPFNGNMYDIRITVGVARPNVVPTAQMPDA